MFLGKELCYWLLGCAFKKTNYRLANGCSITQVKLDTVYLDSNYRYVYVVPCSGMTPIDILFFESFCCRFFF